MRTCSWWDGACFCKVTLAAFEVRRMWWQMHFPVVFFVIVLASLLWVWWVCSLSGYSQFYQGGCDNWRILPVFPLCLPADGRPWCSSCHPVIWSPTGDWLIDASCNVFLKPAACLISGLAPSFTTSTQQWIACVCISLLTWRQPEQWNKQRKYLLYTFQNRSWVFNKRYDQTIVHTMHRLWVPHKPLMHSQCHQFHVDVPDLFTNPLAPTSTGLTYARHPHSLASATKSQYFSYFFSNGFLSSIFAWHC